MSDDRLNAYDAVEERGFFFYSGANGDLCRKNGLSGWRLSLMAGLYRIQKKSEFWAKQGKIHWNTVFTVEDDDGYKLSRSQKQKFLDKVDELIEDGTLEEVSDDE